MFVVVCSLKMNSINRVHFNQISKNKTIMSLKSDSLKKQSNYVTVIRILNKKKAKTKIHVTLNRIFKNQLTVFLGICYWSNRFGTCISGPTVRNKSGNSVTVELCLDADVSGLTVSGLTTLSSDYMAAVIRLCSMDKSK